MGFLIEHYKKVLFSLFACCMIFSMMVSQAMLSPEKGASSQKGVSYRIGKDKEFVVSKAQIEAMKVYLSHDMGYGFNDVLVRQNIFGDGFFVEMLTSTFGRKLLEDNFSLIKEDFSKAISKHKSDTMYRHKSLKFSLIDELKRYAPTLYNKYQHCVNYKDEVDVALLSTYIDLIYEHTLFRPKDMKMLTRIFCRDRKLAYDATIEKRNMALFHAKNYEDILGKNALEILAQGVLYLAHIAESNGYATTFEEASGIMQRRGYELIDEVYKEVEEKSEKDKIFASFANGLQVSKKQLIQAGKGIITIEKMYKDVSASVIVDEGTLKTLFKDIVEQAEVVMVQDQPIMNIRSVENALCVDMYLDAIGEKKGFLEVPLHARAEGEILKKNEDLFVENMQFKVARISVSELKNSISHRRVIDYQVSDDGWEKIAKKFRFEGVEKDNRYNYMHALKEAKIDEIADFCRESLVSMDEDSLKEALSKKSLQKKDYMRNSLALSNLFYKGFDEDKFLSLIEKAEGKHLPFYTQNGKDFFNVVLISRDSKKKLLSCLDAYKNGFLQAMLEKRLIVLNKGREIKDSDAREKLVSRLIMRKDPVQAESIQEMQKQKKIYFTHQEKRVRAYFDGEKINSEDDLLKQFSLQDSKTVVTRFNNNSEMAKKELFALAIGEKSEIKHLKDGRPYFVVMEAKRIDHDKLKKVKRRVHSELAKEVRDEFEEKVSRSYFAEKWIAMKRINKD